MNVMVAATSNIIPVCLVNKKLGTPFISSLELTFISFLYIYVYSGRYPDDHYDRMWFAGTSPQWIPSNTSSSINSSPEDGFDVPSTVMRTAVTPVDGFSIQFAYWNMTEHLADAVAVAVAVQYNIFMHFAEIQLLGSNESRIIDIYLNGKPWQGQGGFRPRYLKVDTLSILHLTQGFYNLTIAKAANSTLPPLINAIEAYEVRSITELATHSGDGMLSPIFFLVLR